MKDTVDPQIAKQIRALDMKYDEAFNKNDAAAVAARFTEDAVQVAPEGVFFFGRPSKKGMQNRCSSSGIATIISPRPNR